MLADAEQSNIEKLSEMTKPLPPTQKPARPSVSSWLFRSVTGLLRKRVKVPVEPKVARAKERPVPPTKAETALLPPFPGLCHSAIFVPKTRAECQAAADEILAAGVTGFDTEAKPTFRPGEKSGGPHVVQFALTDKAYIFQLHRRDCLNVVALLIESEQVLKVGFGLKNDYGQIRNRLGVVPGAVLDLDHVFRKKGYGSQMGVRAAMGAVLCLSFPKSKTITTSNWAAAELTAKQLRYAANDAFAALKIMEALNLEPGEISGNRRPGRSPVRHS